MSAPPKLELKFGGRLVEQLGAQLYPSATATVAELISNAWDADAHHVWVEMPFGDWAGAEIVVVDDGVGMSFEEARDHYLVVGRNRRQSGQRSPSGRLVHGRKGIGKLAAFGTASILEVKTKRNGGDEVAFRLDYDRIRAQEPTSPYQVEASEDPGELANPRTGEPLTSGTRIRLSGLRLQRRLDPEQFSKSMSRRFALGDHEMSILINGERLSRFDLDLEYRFPPDRVPPGVVEEGGWATEVLPDGHTVHWWIGFTAKPIKDDAQQGISVIVRGKLAQRPFKFEAGGGTTDQLGQEYLVGEVRADWIDDENANSDDESDYIQSNRDQLQLEDEFLAPFLDWGRQRMRWALSARGDLKRENQQRKLKANNELQRMLDGRPKRERAALNRIAAAIARLPSTGDQEVVRVMEAVIGARAEETTRALAHDISLAGGDPDAFWSLVRELAELDGRSALAFIDARLETLGQLRTFEPGGMLEAAVELFISSPGLLNPEWETADVAEVAGVVAGFRSVTVSTRGNERAVALVPSSAVQPEAIAAAIEAVGPQYPDAEIIVLGPDESVMAGALSWESLLSESERMHSLWRALVEARVLRSTPS